LQWFFVTPAAPVRGRERGTSTTIFHWSSAVHTFIRICGVVVLLTATVMTILG
jgi:hypothetical protein